VVPKVAISNELLELQTAVFSADIRSFGESALLFLFPRKIASYPSGRAVKDGTTRFSSIILYRHLR